MHIHIHTYFRIPTEAWLKPACVPHIYIILTHIHVTQVCMYVCVCVCIIYTPIRVLSMREEHSTRNVNNYCVFHCYHAHHHSIRPLIYVQQETICVCMYTYVCMCVYIHIYIYMYTRRVLICILIGPGASDAYGTSIKCLIVKDLWRPCLCFLFFLSGTTLTQSQGGGAYSEFYVLFVVGDAQKPSLLHINKWVPTSSSCWLVHNLLHSLFLAYMHRASECVFCSAHTHCACMLKLHTSRLMSTPSKRTMSFVSMRAEIHVFCVVCLCSWCVVRVWCMFDNLRVCLRVYGWGLFSVTRCRVVPSPWGEPQASPSLTVRLCQTHDSFMQLLKPASIHTYRNSASIACTYHSRMASVCFLQYSSHQCFPLNTLLP